VYTGNAVTQVYGTRFNIEAYAAAAELRVALQRGKIGIASGASEREEVLQPGQLFIYHKQTHTREIKQLRPADMGSWITGTLVLYQTPLTDLFLLLKTRYGIEVVDRRKTRDNPAITSARFSHLPLEVLLKHLSFGWDFRFNQAKDTLYIK
jgi:ferric-dicitrate binding protein FerR (iron transport regulator)